MDYKIKNVTIFVAQCPHCKGEISLESYELTKEEMDKHVDECVGNPKNKNCIICKYYSQSFFNDHYGDCSNKESGVGTIAANYTCKFFEHKE